MQWIVVMHHSIRIELYLWVVSDWCDRMIAVDTVCQCQCSLVNSLDHFIRHSSECRLWFASLHNGILDESVRVNESVCHIQPNCLKSSHSGGGCGGGRKAFSFRKLKITVKWRRMQESCGWKTKKQLTRNKIMFALNLNRLSLYYPAPPLSIPRFFGFCIRFIHSFLFPCICHLCQSVCVWVTWPHCIQAVNSEWRCEIFDDESNELNQV